MKRLFAFVGLATISPIVTADAFHAAPMVEAVAGFAKLPLLVWLSVQARSNKAQLKELRSYLFSSCTATLPPNDE